MEPQSEEESDRAAIPSPPTNLMRRSRRQPPDLHLGKFAEEESVSIQCLLCQEDLELCIRYAEDGSNGMVPILKKHLEHIRSRLLENRFRLNLWISDCSVLRGPYIGCLGDTLTEVTRSVFLNIHEQLCCVTIGIGQLWDIADNLGTERGSSYQIGVEELVTRLQKSCGIITRRIRVLADVQTSIKRAQAIKYQIGPYAYLRKQIVDISTDYDSISGESDKVEDSTASVTGKGESAMLVEEVCKSCHQIFKIGALAFHQELCDPQNLPVGKRLSLRQSLGTTFDGLSKSKNNQRREQEPEIHSRDADSRILAASSHKVDLTAELEVSISTQLGIIPERLVLKPDAERYTAEDKINQDGDDQSISSDESFREYDSDDPGLGPKSRSRYSTLESIADTEFTEYDETEETKSDSSDDFVLNDTQIEAVLIKDGRGEIHAARTLIDTGAESSFISREAALSYGLKERPLMKPDIKTFASLDGKGSFRPETFVKVLIKLEILGINDFIKASLRVSEVTEPEILLGGPFIKKHKVSSILPKLSHSGNPSVLETSKDLKGGKATD